MKLKKYLSLCVNIWPQIFSLSLSSLLGLAGLPKEITFLQGQKPCHSHLYASAWHCTKHLPNRYWGSIFWVYEETSVSQLVTYLIIFCYLSQVFPQRERHLQQVIYTPPHPLLPSPMSDSPRIASLLLWGNVLEHLVKSTFHRIWHKIFSRLEIII